MKQTSLFCCIPYFHEIDTINRITKLRILFSEMISYIQRNVKLKDRATLFSYQICLVRINEPVVEQCIFSLGVHKFNKLSKTIFCFQRSNKRYKFSLHFFCGKQPFKQYDKLIKKKNNNTDCKCYFIILVIFFL